MADKGLPQKRVSRACTYCRARKSRCDLDASGGQPPCGRCVKENRECVLATSNRGGSRVRKKKATDGNVSGSHLHLGVIQEDGDPSTSHSATLQTSPSFQRPLPPAIATHVSGRPRPLPSSTNPEPDDGDNEDDDASTADSALATAIPRNPSDAWQLLKDVATREADALRREASNNAQLSAGNGSSSDDRREARGSVNGIHAGIASYRLVREGYLPVDVIQMLVRRYSEHYHPYLPLVPRKYFQPSQLDAFAISNKHLLTAVLTISSKDLIEQPNIHTCCSRYMHDLISGIAAGADCEVEAVEALLLLAEWEPQGLRNRIEAVGRGEEDRAAWMHVGIALRSAYFLGIDRTSFRTEDPDTDTSDHDRKRFAWASCYVSDRLISVRVGRAFWSRGPGPMTGLSSRDFPSLAPQAPSDEDHAKIFQATLDLTQLYTNVHDVLYSGMRTSGQMMLMGDYVKYVDDFRAAIARWNTSWGPLACSHHIKCTLQLSYEYLVLYTNAFVFQAAISQAIARHTKHPPPGATTTATPSASHTNSDPSVTLRDHLKSTFSCVASMPDARFIFSSLAAAKAYLTLLSTQIDPARHLRYLPLRYYLYGIYSAVFLYKARSFGVMDALEERQVRQLVYQTTEVLKRASVSAQDPGSRYARLLELLWLKSAPSVPRTAERHHQVQSQGPMPGQAQPSMSSPAEASDTGLSSTGSLRMDAHGFMQFSPANDFSWLDLEAVGDFVSGDQMGGMPPNLGEYTSGGYGMDQGAMGWAQGAGVGAGVGPGGAAGGWQFDLNGNLLF
ncbi:uncharacterized protein HMPREF1541_00717 [Cyphellophora europaea CBS 101466]|uniref:Zn(2)-C6 fungal-type domain-containing protein n=1 Tax=Cyphellophora europaea (strain CBS 101466) TaxID=1220924 RepID=W2SCV9_CYPE1|nr:uncharacterized protein HMPREF1541_00717 [Cyphellophora europaea CBS 101466]ETN46532.1 hypothetical protein HMPREF1541_00717 [Cyphellophora europaea CBS 101466]